jgi:hypothetical protein
MRGRREGEQYETARSPMTSDPDIYRAAKLLIDQHGEDAPLRAAEWADGRLSRLVAIALIRLFTSA